MKTGISPETLWLRVGMAVCVGWPWSYALTTDVYWVRVPEGANVQAMGTPETVACGSLGVFYFATREIRLFSDREPVGKTAVSSSTAGASAPMEGRETPPSYLSLPGIDAPDWILDDAVSWFGNRQRPWVAMIDFGEVPDGDCGACNPANVAAHGHAVAWAIRLLSDERVNVALFPLDENRTFTGSDLSQASDLHFLIQLCELAEYIEQHPMEPPLAVNMSFGRVAAGDLGPCDPEVETTLSCQIRTALNALSDRGIALVAAAGNYQGSQFPAGVDSVISTGRLNLHSYNGSNYPGVWQNSQGVEAYFPGDGLSLEREGAPTLSLPSGSSFATAAFSAVLASILLDSPMSDLNEGLYYPKRLLVGGYRLVHMTNSGNWGGAMPLAFHSALDRLRASSVGAFNAHHVATPAWSASNPLDLPSLPERQASQNLPGPETKPCLPCTGYRNGDLLSIDLSGSQPLPDGWRLQDLYLRIGAAEDYRFDFSADDIDLTSFQNAEAGQVEFDVSGFEPGLTSREQIALIFVIEDVNDSDGFFWTSANVIIPEQVAPDLD